MATKGRPPRYTKQLGEAICLKIATGQSLRKACKKHKIDHTTVLEWLLDDKYPAFSHQYARAREIQYYGYADDIIERAEDRSLDRGETVITEEGFNGKESFDKKVTKVVSDPVAVQRDRLEVDAKKWVLSKLLPKKYGDKIETPKEPEDEKPYEATQRIVISEPKPKRLQESE